MTVNVLRFHLPKPTEWRSPAKAAALAAILALAAYTGHPILGALVFTLAALRVYWSFGPDRIRVRWLFTSISIAGAAGVFAVSPTSWEPALAALGYALAVGIALAIFEFRMPKPDLWYRLIATLAVWAAAAAGYALDFAIISPFLGALVAVFTTREYLRMTGEGPDLTLGAFRRSWIVAAIVGVVAFEAYRIMNLLPFGAVRGAAAVALIVAFLRDIAAFSLRIGRKELSVGAALRQGFREFFILATGIFLLSVLSSWNLP